MPKTDSAKKRKKKAVGAGGGGRAPGRGGGFAARMVEENPELRSGSTLGKLKRRLQRSGRKKEIDGEAFWVVEGDLLLDDDQLAVYADQQDAIAEMVRMKSDRPGLQGTGLIRPQTVALVGILQAGKMVRWKPGLVLTYCVLRSTFLNQAQYERVRDNVVAATGAWEGACGIKFEHRPELDGSATTTPPGVVFPVRFFNAGGAFIAAAFFPDDPTHRRRVLVDPSYFTTSFDPVGVLRHELGHVLGFRHEHIRSGAPAVCPAEDTGDTIDLTQYDPQSCMHYFCGGVGSRELAITQLDRSGSQRLYGPPLAEFIDVE